MQDTIQIIGRSMGAALLTLFLIPARAQQPSNTSEQAAATQTALPLRATHPAPSPVQDAFAVPLNSTAGPVASSSAQTYSAQSPCASESSDLLGILLANGTLTKQQYDLLQEHNQKRCAAEAAEEAANKVAQKAAESAIEKAAIANRVTGMDNGIGFHMGDYSVSISGEVNGYYVHDRADRSVSSNCLLCLATVGGDPTSQVGSGMLPGWVDVLLTTHKGGWDTSVGFGIWPSLNSLIQGSIGVNYAGGNSVALSNSGVDFRQEYLTVGKPTLGTFKIGRDIGFFGSEAILNDMSLFGAGTVSGTGSPSSSVTSPGPGATTVGRIGTGYIYTDFIPQISYASPVYKGVSTQLGVFQPMSDAVSTSLTGGKDTFSAPYTGNGQPMYQVKVNYSSSAKKPVTAKLWFNEVTQKMEANASDVGSDPTLTLGQSAQANGVDYGGKVANKWANLVFYGYNGKGIGTEGLFLIAANPDGGTLRTSRGYYIQPMVTPGKWSFGISYGMSALLPASREVLTPNTNGIMRNNLSWIGQTRYALTNWFSILAEYNHERSESQVGTISTSDSVALGGIAWF
jgi:hypothetical protein